MPPEVGSSRHESLASSESQVLLRDSSSVYERRPAMNRWILYRSLALLLLSGLQLIAIIVLFNVTGDAVAGAGTRFAPTDSEQSDRSHAPPNDGLPVSHVPTLAQRNILFSKDSQLLHLQSTRTFFEEREDDTWCT